MCVAGLIYCMCSTGVSWLTFYGLSKSSNMLDCIATNNHCSKREHIPEKMAYFQKTYICKLCKND